MKDNDIHASKCRAAIAFLAAATLPCSSADGSMDTDAQSRRTCTGHGRAASGRARTSAHHNAVQSLSDGERQRLDRFIPRQRTAHIEAFDLAGASGSARLRVAALATVWPAHRAALCGLTNSASPNWHRESTVDETHPILYTSYANSHLLYAAADRRRAYQ